MGPTASDSHGGSGPNEVRRELRDVQLINVQPGWLIGDHYVTGVASGKFWKREFHRKRMGKKKHIGNHWFHRNYAGLCVICSSWSLLNGHDHDHNWGYRYHFRTNPQGKPGFFSVQWRLKFLKIVIHPRIRGDFCSFLVTTVHLSSATVRS